MKKLLKLKPRGKFFFGGSRTFADGRQSYYAHSEYFPQQTALLGMLRFSLLKLHEALDKTSEDKEAIIGTDFDGENLKDFKHIKGISPVFILENQTSWFPVGKDHQYYKDKNDSKNKVYTYLKYDGIANKPEISGFDPKENLLMRLAPYANNYPNGVLSKDYDHFFKTVSTVGNKKNDENDSGRTNKGLQEAFYKDDKLIFCTKKGTYKSPFAFGIWVDCEDDLSKIGSVFLGREAVFDTEVIDSQSSIFDDIEVKNNDFTEASKCKIILLSNTYVEDLEALRKNADFILAGDAVPFLYIKSPDDKKSFFNMPNNNQRRSVQTYLLERGTVIYPKNLNEIKKILDNQAFRQIGYNYYSIQSR